jgi:predicted nucleic acid-binding protein
MKPTLYLLDTNVLLALIRGNELGRYIRQTYTIDDPTNRSVISVVSHGEVWAIAQRNGWGEKKKEALRKMLENVVTIDLNSELIIAAYVEVDAANHAVPGGARQLANNDMWIAASAKAAGAILLTTDQDFQHLHPTVITIQYIDPGSKLPMANSGTQQTIQ